LAAHTTAANCHDVTQLLPLVDSIPSIKGKIGHPKYKPDELLADRGYDSEPHRIELRQRNIKPYIAKRRTENGSRLGIYRYVVEQTFGILHRFRRLRTRYEKLAENHEAFLTAACALICWRRLENSFC